MKSLAEEHQQSTVGDPGQPAVGLRERKKARTRASIREHAMRLFREQGYGETTVEKIAEAAEVSPSTFFRYFPTKEDVVISDDYDPLLIAAFRAQPPEMSVVDALRESVRAVFSGFDRPTLEREAYRHQLMETVPELRAAMYTEYRRSIDLVASLAAERVGSGSGELRDSRVRRCTDRRDDGGGVHVGWPGARRWRVRPDRQGAGVPGGRSAAAREVTTDH